MIGLARNAKGSVECRYFRNSVDDTVVVLAKSVIWIGVLRDRSQCQEAKHYSLSSFSIRDMNPIIVVFNLLVSFL